MGRDDFELDEILKSIGMLHPIEQKAGSFAADRDYTGYSQEELERQGFGEAQIEEISLGIKQQLPVWHYTRNCYNWKQMREIRMGLLENLQIAMYDNYLFSAEQMREIRMGLMDELDVSTYANLMLSAKDMAVARKNLLSDAYQSHPGGYAKETMDEKSGILIRISDDCMQAYMLLPENRTFGTAELERVLNRNDVICGIIGKQLKKAAEGACHEGEILIAEGRPALMGKDGSYEYFFNPLLPGEPKVNPDGSVDYTNVIVADKRNVGDVLAKYHPAEQGVDGETVTGIVIRGVHGKELPILQGQGIARNVEKNLYVAAVSGFVVLDEEESTLNVWDIYVVNGDVNRYNGHISYNGMIHICGSVSDMAQIEASGNVVIDGYVEGAHIKAGENIILRSGMNGCGRGVLEAGGSVAGKFFEGATICARGNVEANYFLNCNVVTDRSLIAKGSKSKIMGGSIKAGYSVEASTIAAAGKGVTNIDVGDLEWIGKRLRDALEQLAKTDDELRQLIEGKEKIGGIFGEEAAQQNALFHKTCIAIRMKEEEDLKLRAEIQYYDQMTQRARKAYIKAFCGVQPGVTLAICGIIRKTEANLSGLITFEEEGRRKGTTCGTKF